MPEQRRFPPPWSVDDPDMKLGQGCFIVRDANRQALANTSSSPTALRQGLRFRASVPNVLLTMQPHAETRWSPPVTLPREKDVGDAGVRPP
jgi:hypothetical protein